MDLKHNEKKLIYMFAVWEHEGDIRHLISLLKWLKELVALASWGRLSHKCAPLLQKFRFKKISTGLR